MANETQESTSIKREKMHNWRASFKSLKDSTSQHKR